jgi:hypothetical protein
MTSQPARTLPVRRGMKDKRLEEARRSRLVSAELEAEEGCANLACLCGPGEWCFCAAVAANDVATSEGPEAARGGPVTMSNMKRGKRQEKASKMGLDVLVHTSAVATERQSS